MYLHGQSASDTSAFSHSDYFASPFVVNPFTENPKYGLPGDSLLSYRGFFDRPLFKPTISVNIDESWESITITEVINGQHYKIPFTASMDWFFYNKMRFDSKQYFLEKLSVSKVTQGQTTGVQRGKSLEIVGMDLGDFGRASLRVNGNVNVAGKMIYQDQEIAALSYAESQRSRFDIDQKQHLNIEGTIGDRITVSMDQDSERDFDWENNIKISYNGKEDEILQRIEAGNTSLALPATKFVTFTGNNQGLFGVKALAKLGPIDITTIAAIEQTKKAKQKYSGAGQSQTQEIRDYEYIKNQYFFIHEWFRNGISDNINGKQIDLPSYYPLDEEGRHYRGNYQIVDFELYQLDQSNNPAADVGTAYIDPSQQTEYPDHNKEGTFLRLERDIDYYLNIDLGYVRLKSRAQDQILGAHYKLVNKAAVSDTVLTVGHGLIQTDSSLVLKMIKPQSSHPNHPTWDLMFKNVYYLGTTNIDSSGFAVRIKNNYTTPVSDRDVNGTYISQFGIDKRNENGAKIPDEKVDIDNIVFMNYGELHLPYLHPFVYNNNLDGGNDNTDMEDVLGEGKMYTSTVYSEYSADSRFTIEADYSNQSSTINLGFMIVDGSEEVYSNGAKLTRNQDYTIDYFSGSVNIIKSDFDPNAEIEVKYEKNELVSFDKKVIFGSRAQMDISENAFIGATALYYNQSVINEKIEVGYEPTRNFIWDVNGRYGRDLDRLTYYLDKLPIIKTDARSNFSIEGEFAQVFPNPNSVSNKATGDKDGLAYIDDFEGSKRSDQHSLIMYNWKQASAPINLETGRKYNQRHRAKLYWYNPYGDLLTSNIWPNQSTSIQAGDNTVKVLVLDIDKNDYQSSVDKDSLWAGIVSPFHSGNYDQTQRKFFEIWIKGSEGKLTVDLGKISEDWNDNGILNTEDVPAAGFVQGNGIMDDGEDLGMDGADDEYEDGWGGAIDSTLGLTYQDYLNNGETVLINPNVENVNDPNGDNWYYNEKNPYDYQKANGTQGNRFSTGGTYPDTEDLDRSGFLDKTNNYFTKTIPLDRTQYFVDETKQNDGTPTGWQLFRIPLSHFEKINEVDWSEIRYIRLVWSGVNTNTELGIARIELVGNDWQELGVSELVANEYTKSDSAFAIKVINTDENPEYIPPDGVKGEYNPIYDTRSKEQSLVLDFQDLPANYKGAAQKTLFALTGERAQSYLTYDKMKMYVHGVDSKWITKDETDVELFMQFGLGEQYYEITQPVYSGWDEDENRNSINLDLDWLTKLKISDTESIKKVNETDIFVDSADVKKYYFTDESGNFTGKKVIIKGEPALSRIQQFIVGINNKTNEPISGQVWIDELRLSNVKKEKGVAMRVQSNLQLADIGKASIIYSKQDADFHVLQQRLGSNKSSEDLRINTSLQLQKFLPENWGLAVPLTFSYSNSNRTPKYYPGTDVRVNENAVPDSIIDLSESVNISTSLTKTKKSKNKWLKYTIDNLTGSFSSVRTSTSNEIMKEIVNESYSGKLAYNYSFARDNFIKPFKWLNDVPILGTRLGKMNFYYSPMSVNAGIDFNEKLVQKAARVGGRSPDEYNFGLNRTFNIAYRLTDNLEVKYNTAAQSDMDAYRAKIIKAVLELDPGIVTNTNENLSTTFNPVITEWLKPSFNYSAAYRWDKPLTSSIDGANISSQLRFTSNLTLNLVTIFDSLKSTRKNNTNTSEPKSTRRRRSPAEEKPERVEEPPEESINRESETKPDRRARTPNRASEIKALENEAKVLEGNEKVKVPFRDRIQKVMKSINPINLTYSSNLNRGGVGVQGTVPTGYKFGWLSDHGLLHSENVGTNTGQWNYSRNLSIRSGLKLSTKANINLNYVQDLGINKTSGADLELHSLSRDFLAFGEKLESGIPFTSWTVRVTGVEKWPLIKKIAKSASLEHAFSGKETNSWKIEGVANVPTTSFFDVASFKDVYSDYLVQSRVNTSYSPLIGMSMSLEKGVSINIRHNYSRTAERSPTGLTLKKEQSVSLSSNYAHTGGFTIPLPFIDDFRVDNTMNFTMNADFNSSNTLASKDNTNLTETGFNTSWKAGLRVSYSFSSRLTGAVILEYRESDSKHVGKKIDRDIGFDLNFAISG